jgi:hypothetical protein
LFSSLRNGPSRYSTTIPRGRSNRTREVNFSFSALKPTSMSAIISASFSERMRVATTHGRNSG